MAEEVDPNGERTLGVLTKPDLVDKGGEHNVIDLVQGEKKPLRLGYCIVRNRGQNELSASSSDRHDRENEFFRTQPWASLNKERVGLVALQNRLRELLVDITRREFPRVKIEIEKALAESQKRLAGLGPSRESKEQQQQYLIKLATEFQKLTDDALDARYGRHDLLGDPDLRLPTLVVRLSDKFSKDLHACGHTVCLEAAKSKAAETKPTATLPSTPGESSGQADTEKGYPERSFGEVWSDEYPELSELLGEAYNCPLPLEDDPMVWIAAEFHASRGFEIGTFNPAILSTLWKEQSAKWEGLALNYIKRVIFVVHSFMQGVLWELCPDDHVIRHNLLSLLMEEVMHRYQQAVEHVKFILRVERSGSLLTMNHYFAENLEKAREERRRVALNEQSFSIAEGGGPVVLLDQAVRSAPVGNAEHSVQEIHDILKSYYKVVRKRFVDAVCTQGADYHLITGTNGPLRVFSPALIASLSAEQLNFIAGEELVSRRERRTLMQQIEALKQGKKLLAI
ncbi:MAG: hypothetical protein M1826_005935 [Phylliscum demangeonii]|nr:MAG: hypothetical protein M1826_005935 [Phylliscum demangeonii]